MVDIFSGLFFALFSLFVIYISRGFKKYALEDGLGAGSIPTIYAVLVLFLSILLIIFSLIKVLKEKKNQEVSDPNISSPETPTPGNVRHLNFQKIKETVILSVILFLYLLLLKPVGYLITTPILVFIIMKIMEAKTRSAIFASIMLTGAIYIIFKILLGVMIPGLPSL